MNLVHFLVAAGVIQGLVLAVIMLRTARRERYGALRWLAAFVASFSMMTVSDWLVETQLILQLPHAYQVFDLLILWLGPFCYFYVRAVLGLPALSRARIVLHLLPGLLILGLLMPCILQGTTAKIAMIKADLLLVVKPGVGGFEILLLLSVLAYLLLALWRLHQYRVSLESHYANTERFKMRWLVLLLGYCALMWLLWLMAVQWAPTSLGIAIQLSFALGVYALGYGGLSQPRLWKQLHANTSPVAPEQSRHPDNPTNKESSTPTAQESTLDTLAVSPLVQPDLTSELPKYAKSGINALELAEIGERLSGLMTTELTFLESELSLADLASRLAVSPHAISQTLNVHFQKNFFEFVNDFRVKEVQRCFTDPAFDQQSVLDIALASGFATKATFNATFKRLTGITPSASRKQLQQNRGAGPQIASASPS
jgi:AraC-like DNA-binding protein